jgi:hypothetical protein
MANFGENERELVGQTYVDKSGTITTGGTAQTLMTASTDANGRFVYNPNASGSLWVNVLGGTAAANGAGSIEVVPGQLLPIDTCNAISIIHASTGAKFTAGEA